MQYATDVCYYIGMFEKPTTIRQETAPAVPKDARLDEIVRIENELQKQPDLKSYFATHPDYTPELQEVLSEYFGENFLSAPAHVVESALDSLRSFPTTTAEGTGELVHTVSAGKLLQIYESYRNALDEYEKKERDIYARLNLNGEKFENLGINRLIRKLYAGNGSWNDLNDDVYIPAFHNEWQRLYQVIRNEDPLSTLGWRSIISNHVIDIIYEFDSDREKGEGDDDEEVFNAIDSYFDIENIDPRFITTIIDLLYQSQELEKENYDAFSDPSGEIDQRIHTYRDREFEGLLHRYIESRLKPHVKTAFQTFKYDAVMEVWENADPNYTDRSEMTLTQEQLATLVGDSGTNRSVTSSHLHDRGNVVLELTEDCFADYVANDAFYVIEVDTQGNRTQMAIKDMLESRGVDGMFTSNEGIAEYRSLMDLRARTSLEKAFGFKLLDLTVKEQYFFLNYLQRVTVADAETMKYFTSLYGVDGMRTFLSLEQGDETLGDKIVAFGAHHEDAKRIFAYYAHILDSTDRAEQLLSTAAHSVHLSPEEIHAHTDAIRQRTQLRADRVLTKAIIRGDSDGILKEIQHASLETAGVGATYAELLQAGVIKGIEDLERIQTHQYTGGDILEDTALLASIGNLYRENYSDAAAEEHIATLHQKLSQPHATMHVLQLNGKVLASVLMITGEETTYVGALNATADPEVRSLPLGTHMIETVVEAHAAAGETLEAHAQLENAIAYINRYNFSATKVLSEEPLRFALIRNDARAKLSKSLSKADILANTVTDPSITIIKTSRQNPSLINIPESTVVSRIEMQKDSLYFVCEPSAY